MADIEQMKEDDISALRSILNFDVLLEMTLTEDTLKLKYRVAPGVDEKRTAEFLDIVALFLNCTVEEEPEVA